MRIALVILIGAGTVSLPLRTQPAVRGLTFEAASIRPVKAPNGVTVSGGKMMVTKGAIDPQRLRNTGGPGTDDPTRIHYPLISLTELLKRAWGDSYFEIESPGWLDGQLFAVNATMPPGTTKEQFTEMLRNLITDRFKLQYHAEPKEIAGYNLVVVKNGLKIKPSPDQSEGTPGPPAQPTSRDADGFPILPPRAGAWCVFFEVPGDRHRAMCQQQTMHDIAKLWGTRSNTAVTDTTGLTGKFDFTLTYAGSLESGGTPEELQPLPDFFSALQSQLGLKLESKKAPVEVMVVDHIERTPAGN